MVPGGEPQQLGVAVVAMALFGAVVGMTVRRVAKLLALVVVVQLAVYRYLESKGLLSLQVGDVAMLGQSGFGGPSAVSVAGLVSTGVLGVGFAVGFVFGLTRT